MRVIFATSSTDDFVSSCCWDGLQELLGEENVFDAGYTPNLHRSGDNHLGTIGRISATRIGRCLEHTMSGFDALVLNRAYFRDHDHNQAGELLRYLASSGELIWIDGEDTTDTGEPLNAHAYFKREIVPGGNYPVHYHPFLMSAPRRWFTYTDDRPVDVFFAGWEGSNPIRWEMLRQVFQTGRHHRTIIASTGVNDYWTCLRQTKIALCPPGGGSDCMRHWEVVAAGAIPLFLCHPARRREAWFGGDEAIFCDNIGDLPAVIEHWLNEDLGAMRARMQKKALREHTTVARARRMLELSGMTVPKEPGRYYACGCPAVDSDKIKGSCPVHHKGLVPES